MLTGNDRVLYTSYFREWNLKNCNKAALVGICVERVEEDRVRLPPHFSEKIRRIIKVQTDMIV